MRQGELPLAVHADTLMPALTLQQATARYNLLVDFAKNILREGRDYGVIPGTERHRQEGEPPNPKDNTLLKPGAEKLCTLFGLAPVFERDGAVEDFERGFFTTRTPASCCGTPAASSATARR
jgi:hypothetical protein